MKIAAHTLGCKLNYAETSDLLRRFSTLGHTIVDFHQAADLYIINTCTVTAVAEKKCRTAIRQAHRLNPEAQVAVIGCFAQVAARDIEAIPGVTLVLGNDRKHLLPQLIEVKGSETGVRGSERTNVEDDTIVPSLPLTPSHSPISVCNTPPATEPEPSSKSRTAATTSAPIAPYPSPAAARARPPSRKPSAWPAA